MTAWLKYSTIMNQIQAHALSIDNNQRHNFIMARYSGKLIKGNTPTQQIDIHSVEKETTKEEIKHGEEEEPIIDDILLDEACELKNFNTPLV